MKNLLVILIISIFSNFTFGQTHTGRCNIGINDVSPTTSFGYLISYRVNFKNKSQKTVDFISWEAYYYNNANEFIEKEKFSFNSTDYTDPISSGFTRKSRQFTKIYGASKVIIKITKVHFTDGTICK